MKRLTIILLGLLLSISTGFAGEKTPAGHWVSESGESRYKVTMCGDGTQLCAKLTWLRSDFRTAENLQYLNKYILRGAKPTGPNKWRGTVDVYGESATGNITAVSDDKLKLTGCKLVVCQTIEFNRL